MTVTDDLRERLVALTRDLMLIPGCAARPDELERCCAFVSNHVDAIADVEVRRIRHEGVPSLLALPRGIASPRVVLCGHLDVISHPDPQAYRPRVEGRRIVGPGAGDMKGALAALIMLFHAFHRRRPGCSLGLLVTSDEEVGGMAGVRHIFEDLGFRCGGVVLPDGGALDRVTVQEKGLMHVRLRTEGHAAHAARPWLGGNAIDRICDALARVRERFARFPVAENHWHPTCVVTAIATPNRTRNRVPEKASAHLDIRFPPPYTVADMDALLREAAGPDVQAEILLSAEPASLAPEPAYLDAIESVLTRRPVTGFDHGGSDGRFICRHGIPVMMSRPDVGELHDVDEWIDIPSLVTFYTMVSRYLEWALADEATRP